MMNIMDHLWHGARSSGAVDVVSSGLHGAWCISSVRLEVMEIDLTLHLNLSNCRLFELYLFLRAEM